MGEGSCFVRDVQHIMYTAAPRNTTCVATIPGAHAVTTTHAVVLLPVHRSVPGFRSIAESKDLGFSEKELATVAEEEENHADSAS